MCRGCDIAYMEPLRKLTKRLLFRNNIHPKNPHRKFFEIEGVITSWPYREMGRGKRCGGQPVNIYLLSSTLQSRRVIPPTLPKFHFWHFTSVLQKNERQILRKMKLHKIVQDETLYY